MAYSLIRLIHPIQTVAAVPQGLPPRLGVGVVLERMRPPSFQDGRYGEIPHGPLRTNPGITRLGGSQYGLKNTKFC
jgi:hypothetical protein